MATETAAARELGRKGGRQTRPRGEPPGPTLRDLA